MPVVITFSLYSPRTANEATNSRSRNSACELPCVISTIQLSLRTDTKYLCSPSGKCLIRWMRSKGACDVALQSLRYGYLLFYNLSEVLLLCKNISCSKSSIILWKNLNRLCPLLSIWLSLEQNSQASTFVFLENNVRLLPYKYRSCYALIVNIKRNNCFEERSILFCLYYRKRKKIPTCPSSTERNKTLTEPP